MPSCVNSICTFSVSSSASYCIVRHASVPVRMRSKSAIDSESSSTRIGKRPCSSGIKSDGLARWKAPEAMNRIWSVFTVPYFVLTVVPSTKGSKSRCTPARDTSTLPPASEREAILSISSRNTMPFCSTLAIAFCFSSSSLTRRAASSSTSSFIASLILSLRIFMRLPPMPENIDLICSVISSMPGGAMISICGPRAHLAHLLFAGLLDPELDQIADDSVNVAADIADFGEFRGFNLDEGRIGELGQPPRDLGLADAGRADHQDILGRDFVPQRLFNLLPAPAVAQRNRHCALGARLAYDMFIEFGDNLLRSHVHDVFRGILDCV